MLSPKRLGSKVGSLGRASRLLPEFRPKGMGQRFWSQGLGTNVGYKGWVLVICHSVGLLTKALFSKMCNEMNTNQAQSAV